ncbi:class II aldolase/adducin family protein [Coriobacterium glomerans PW2]|uniref:Class II aldolase/adducin family protein n=1 Tax=Coriobacterium glomerans (strain ATCC 49209 / DSM 20642 / JCM 10262 / PW2) TaxID=700015 RepID=F2NBV0_CORGP|nr:class II aldolase/adducin family protein [Coriobacterium glomerans]AEB06909.1 class II aldolase/adducin family protein [Coriobacterium glomerans PW2]
MEEQCAREALVKAGIRLIDAGLIARTWGNVSCRLDADRFVITPSGRDYNSLSPDDMVPVRIDDLSWDGDTKPSSEKGVHAEIYAARPWVNFIIHTHQINASAVSAAGLSSIDAALDLTELSSTIPCAAYGLPGTKTLRKNVLSALESTRGHAIIMSHHGAVCFGRDEQAAFSAARDLETAARRFACDRYLDGRADAKQCDAGDLDDEMRRRAVEILSANSHVARADLEARYASYANSERAPEGMVLTEAGSRVEIAPDAPDSALTREQRLHRSVYAKNPRIRCIVHAADPDVIAVSRAGITMRPLLDDFAQIVGTRMRTISDAAGRAASALTSSSAVLLAGNGALCCAANADDAHAIRMIVEKNCRAYLWGALLGGAVPLKHLDCRLMRIVYLKKYSKQIKVPAR